jgi:hypothetical protein
MVWIEVKEIESLDTDEIVGRGWTATIDTIRSLYICRYANIYMCLRAHVCFSYPAIPIDCGICKEATRASQ